LRILIQRVEKASVSVNGCLKGKINKGLLIFVGISKSDTNSDIEYVVDKSVNLRLFPDVNGKFHFSVRDIKGELMVISQFTLYGDTRRGRRPSFSDAMGPVEAEDIFNKVIQRFKSNSGLAVAEGQFGSHMDIKLINDGPVTIWLDSEDPR
tara:strand:- start:5022 stop:5474 length:453 start_codon:yes stop_codon:yes gene_type:complete